MPVWYLSTGRASGCLSKIKTTPKGRGMNDKPYKGIIPAAPKGAQ